LNARGGPHAARSRVDVKACERDLGEGEILGQAFQPLAIGFGHGTGAHFVDRDADRHLGAVDPSGVLEARLSDFEQLITRHREDLGRIFFAIDQAAHLKTQIGFEERDVAVLDELGGFFGDAGLKTLVTYQTLCEISAEGFSRALRFVEHSPAS